MIKAFQNTTNLRTRDFAIVVGTVPRVPDNAAELRGHLWWLRGVCRTFVPVDYLEELREERRPAARGD